MNVLSDELVTSIDGRITTINGEIAKLQAARVALVGSAQPQSAGNGGVRRKPGRDNTDTVARALVVIGKQPGIKATAIGPAVGLGDTSGYRLVKALQAQGKVRKGNNGGWYPNG